MQTLEQSLHDTIQQEKQLEDSHVTKEIRALQQVCQFVNIFNSSTPNSLYLLQNKDWTGFG